MQTRPLLLVLRLYEQFNLPAKFRIASFGYLWMERARGSEEEFYNLRVRKNAFPGVEWAVEKSSFETAKLAPSIFSDDLSLEC